MAKEKLFPRGGRQDGGQEPLLTTMMRMILWGAVLGIASATAERTTMEHEDVLKLYQETGTKISQWEKTKKECSAETGGHPQMRIERIKNLPSEDMAGMDHDMLHLCATVSGGVYEAASRADFDRLLQDSGIRKNFPDLSVRFFQNGVTFGRDWFPEQLSLNAPTFIGLITGSTLVLGWRGTVTIKDILADANIDSVAPWRKLKGLEVQKAYYEMITKVYFNSHAKDIANYVKGKYSKVPNKAKKDGTPIKRIILAGHSLGGGLAQVAHLFLRAPPDHPWSRWTSLVNDCKAVEIRTIAISAPMTTVLNNPSSDTAQFLQDVTEPDMRNVVFNADVVPRGYSDLEFIDGFVNAFLNDDNGTASSDLADQLARAFVNLHIRIFKLRGMMEQAERYRHVGRLIYYDNPRASPVVYVDTGFRDPEERDGNEKSFRALRYGPQTKVADTALENHMVLVTTPGLVLQ